MPRTLHSRIHACVLPNAGVLYRELGNMERAVQCYQAALHTRPNFPQVRGCFDSVVSGGEGIGSLRATALLPACVSTARAPPISLTSRLAQSSWL